MRPVKVGAVVIAAAGSMGCSFLFVKGVPDNVERVPILHRVECTSNVLAPVVDTIIGGYQIVRTGAAMAADESDYEEAPISRGADIGFGLGFTALFVASAVYGYVKTAECSKVNSRREKLKQEPPP